MGVRGLEFSPCRIPEKLQQHQKNLTAIEPRSPKPREIQELSTQEVSNLYSDDLRPSSSRIDQALRLSFRCSASCGFGQGGDGTLASLCKAVSWFKASSGGFPVASFWDAMKCRKLQVWWSFADGQPCLRVVVVANTLLSARTRPRVEMFGEFWGLLYYTHHKEPPK